MVSREHKSRADYDARHPSLQPCPTSVYTASCRVTTTTGPCFILGNGCKPHSAISGGGSRVQEGANRGRAVGVPEENVFAPTQAQGQRKASGRTENQN